ncbi:MAG TPA: ECF-type sigma factor [Candidatus Krumholzibacteria bacterium]|nr:ECF-type sigma factor [Candidatus Krumholzibacteria bacterium]
MAEPHRRITEILCDLDPSSLQQAGELFGLVYDELRLMAEHQLRRERAHHTLEPTALVNEAFLKLVDAPVVGLEGRAHFFGVAARAMRQVLVDHARRRRAAKRGGELERVTLRSSIGEGDNELTDILDLHLALEKLSAQDETLGRLVELRFFSGLTLDEAADALGVSRRKAASDWSVARLWLRRELGGGA